MYVTGLNTEPVFCSFRGNRGIKFYPRHCPFRVSSHSTAQVKQTTSALKPLDADYESTHGFASFSNWVVPDHIMVGRYPYVEPGELKKCRTHEQGENQLKQILEAGIRTFVCVQNDIVSQDDMKIGGDKGFLPYKPTAELIAASLQGPPSKEEFEGVRNKFINKFLPQRDESKSTATSPSDCAFVHHPVKGMKTLTPEDVDPVIKDLESRLGNGEKLYVHCWGGRGRGGIVSACLLAQLYGLSAEECVERIGRGFLTRNDDSYSTPLSEEHIAFIHNFVDHLKA